jgi:hypothetical protein
MEDIKKDEIILEDEILNFKKLKKITTSGIEKCICKICIEVTINGELKYKYGTGFLCNISEKNIKAFITNNHLINKSLLDKEKILKIEIEEEDKEINLELKRLKITNDDLDYTIIEIIEEDNIKNFLNIDKYIHSKDYINEQIFSTQHPEGEEKLKR